jgi:hypothetical protein
MSQNKTLTKNPQTLEKTFFAQISNLNVETLQQLEELSFTHFEILGHFEELSFTHFELKI